MQQLLIPGQFARQALLRWDWSSTSRQEVGANDDAVIWFGRFCVLPRARQLLVDGQPVELGSRAFDLLMVLIGAPGALVTKNELLSRVWPDTVVEEGNLKVQMSAVRKVLNEDREVIKTVHGRGYVFTGEVTTASAEPAAFARLGWDPAPASPGPARQTSWSAGSSLRRQLGTGSRMTAADREPQSVVVVIDDDPDIRAALRGLLRAVGLRVQVFASRNSWIAPCRTSRVA